MIYIMLAQKEENKNKVKCIIFKLNKYLDGIQIYTYWGMPKP